MLAISLNLVLGYTGLLSITHASFFGIGAYTTAILVALHEQSFFLSLVISILLTGVIACIFGVILARFNRDVYAIASFGLNIIVFSVLINWDQITRGPLGISGIDRPSIFGYALNTESHFLILMLIVALAIFLISEYIANSSFGRVIKGIREKEHIVKIFGYRTEFFKLIIFIISAGMAAIAGSFFASYITFVDPYAFSINASIFILAIVILGGLANNFGSVLGAGFLILLPEILRFAGFPSDISAHLIQSTYGLLLVLLMLYRPQGLLGTFKL